MTEHRALLPLLVANGNITIVVDRITENSKADTKSISLIREGGNTLNCEIGGGFHSQRLTIHTKTPAEIKMAILQYQKKLAGKEVPRFDQKA